MKNIYFIIAIMIFYNFASPALCEEETRLFTKEINSNKKYFQHKVMIEIERNAEMRIYTVSLEYVPKETTKEKKDSLYIRGTVQKMISGYVLDASVSAEVFDKNGTLIGAGEGKVFPEILKISRFEKGRFKIIVDYKPSIALCKLEVTWPEKSE